MRILIAGTDAKFIEKLKLSLANEGHNVIECTSINDVLNHEHEKVDAYIVDINSDNDNAQQLVELVRQLPSGQNLPIMVSSDHNHFDQVIVALNAGADDYILRPYPARELITRINTVKNRRR